MKKFTVLFMSLFLFFTVSGLEAAEEGPCAVIAEACRAAGFKLGQAASPGKALLRNCIAPILQGKPVENVAVDPKDIEDCRAKRKNGEGQALGSFLKHRKAGRPKAAGDAKEAPVETKQP